MHRKSLSRFFVLALAVMALMMAVGAVAGLTDLVWDQDFSVDTAGWLDDSVPGWEGYGEISHNVDTAQVTGLPDTCPSYLSSPPPACYYGPFSRFDGYRSVWMGTWKAEIDVYLDPAWPLGTGFDYTVAANGSDGNHQRDYIFHVTKDTSTGDLIVAGSNNTNFYPRENLETLNHEVISTAGWYTLQHIFYEDAGALTVDMNLLDNVGTVLFTETRLPRLTGSNTEFIPADVGGNRYSWFTFVNVPGGIEVDNHQLYFAVPTVDPVGDTEVCDPGTVEIQIDDVEGLYGYEFIVTYNKDLVSADGNFVNTPWFDPSGNGFPGPGWNADCNDLTGECRFAYTRGKGDGELATAVPKTIANILFTPTLSGPAGSFDVEVTSVKLTDKDSFEIPGAVGGTLSVDVCGTATVSGQINLQGRPQPLQTTISGPPSVFEVSLTGPYGTFSDLANDTDGTYSIDVTYALGGTLYDIEADHSVYLPSADLGFTGSTGFTVNGDLSGKSTTLLGGDATANNAVGIGDINCINGAFGNPSPGFGTCGTGPTGTPDVNDDGIVNIQDLALAAGNYEIQNVSPNPQPW